MRLISILTVFASLTIVSGAAAPTIEAAEISTINKRDGESARRLLTYLRNQNTTGFLLVRRGEVLLEGNWPAPADPIFAAFQHGRTKSGVLLEDVASLQKSVIAILIGAAADKDLIDVTAPISQYLGAGWSRASREQEAAIRVIDLLTMSSGLDERLGYEAPVGTKFFYNTPAYAILKRVLTSASRLSLEEVTRCWLTGPTGMADTEWRTRPSALADVGNATGLVTTPRDLARLGQLILAKGIAENGRQLLSRSSSRAIFRPARTNGAYGRLWWLNGSRDTITASGARRSGQLIPTAPRDLVAGLGALDRKLYLVPSLDVIVVRTGASADDHDFDEQFWKRLMPLLRSSNREYLTPPSRSRSHVR